MDTKYFGLKSAIANQILRKYGGKNIKKASGVKLTVPRQSVRLDGESKITIRCLGLELVCKYLPYFDYVKQVEIGDKFAYLAVNISN
jgi:hypothetical protein